jgi:hypothetical protein
MWTAAICVSLGGAVGGVIWGVNSRDQVVKEVLQNGRVSEQALEAAGFAKGNVGNVIVYIEQPRSSK